MTQQFIPVLSSESGSCLTPANWQEVAIHSASYHLDTLLFKPGYHLLQELDDLSSYLNWSGPLIINASHLIANREGVISLKSPFDGNKIKVTADELIALIHHLQPEMVLLPPQILRHVPELLDNWNESITLFFALSDLDFLPEEKEFGLYASSDSWSELASHTRGARYLLASSSFDLRGQLGGVDYIQSDDPAKLALEGVVYSSSGLVDLSNDSVRLCFEPIDPECYCPTCSQLYTQAYLHHLYHHTPLLCHRFLIQHNAYAIVKKITGN